MLSELHALLREYPYDNENKFVFSCNRVLLEFYPELKVRWSRIHGKRWAYFCGNNGDSISFDSIRIELNQKYGICIDNGDILSPDELDKIITTLKECFAHEITL